MAQWLRCCATIRKVAGSIPASVIGFFIDIKSFWSHYDPGVDSASNRNECQEHFLGVKVAGAKTDNLPTSCAVVTKSGNLNFLEPSGPVQACNGTDLPFTISILCPWVLHTQSNVIWIFLNTKGILVSRLSTLELAAESLSVAYSYDVLHPTAKSPATKHTPCSIVNIPCLYILCTVKIESTVNHP